MASLLSPEELAALPHDDRGPALVATSWTLTCLGSLLLGLRVYSKMVSHRSLWWDDWILIAACVALVTDAGLATHMVVYFTYGRHSWDFQPPDIDAFVLVVAVRATFTVVAIAWTKTAFAMTLLRLTDRSEWMKRLLWVVIITMNIAMGISALFFWIQCRPLARSWTPSIPGSCWDSKINERYNIFSSAYSAGVDFLLAALPWKLLYNLQITRKEKLGTAIAMSMGVVAGVTGIIKTTKLPKLASPDIYDAADLVIWDIAEAAVTMIGACVPVLRVLVRDVGNSSRRYGASEDASQIPSAMRSGKWKVGDSGADKGPFSSASRTRDTDEDGSEKSILDDAVPRGAIMRVKEVTLKSRPRERSDSLRHGNAFELGNLRPAQ
ncbi:hypothetical protein C8A00DRAFT_18365 [Chaetomidium leptoderma]|uniref:Rhodopsin domain-containing protein n=1 Tax=Chaetomidium leptoderma TaxID=669021 RepID=A0AAN6VEN0_9PEZI|nr:hypothetical protein C8A00DRAFT_18365 [Chaetomidium leptoderma]